jgi:hypothetical protein
MFDFGSLLATPKLFSHHFFFPPPFGFACRTTHAGTPQMPPTASFITITISNAAFALIL